MQNLQKHLLSRAGEWRGEDDDDEAEDEKKQTTADPSKPKASELRDKMWRGAFCQLFVLDLTPCLQSRLRR